jgi:hypothetical protein
MNQQETKSEHSQILYFRILRELAAFQLPASLFKKDVTGALSVSGAWKYHAMGWFKSS